jgi:hypothetical protein
MWRFRIWWESQCHSALVQYVDRGQCGTHFTERRQAFRRLPRPGASHGGQRAVKEFSRELKQSRISAVDIQSPCSIIAASVTACRNDKVFRVVSFQRLATPRLMCWPLRRVRSLLTYPRLFITAQSARRLRAVRVLFL